MQYSSQKIIGDKSCQYKIVSLQNSTQYTRQIIYQNMFVWGLEPLVQSVEAKITKQEVVSSIPGPG